MSNLVKNLRNPDWVKKWFDQAGFQAADRIEELGAKLEKAVRALTFIRCKDNSKSRLARITLAELKGQGHGN